MGQYVLLILALLALASGAPTSCGDYGSGCGNNNYGPYGHQPEAVRRLYVDAPKPGGCGKSNSWGRVNYAYEEGSRNGNGRWVPSYGSTLEPYRCGFNEPYRCGFTEPYRCGFNEPGGCGRTLPIPCPSPVPVWYQTPKCETCRWDSESCKYVPTCGFNPGLISQQCECECGIPDPIPACCQTCAAPCKPSCDCVAPVPACFPSSSASCMPSGRFPSYSSDSVCCQTCTKPYVPSCECFRETIPSCVCTPEPCKCTPPCVPESCEYGRNVPTPVPVSYQDCAVPYTHCYGFDPSCKYLPEPFRYPSCKYNPSCGFTSEICGKGQTYERNGYYGFCPKTPQPYEYAVPYPASSGCNPKPCPVVPLPYPSCGCTPEPCGCPVPYPAPCGCGGECPVPYPAPCGFTPPSCYTAEPCRFPIPYPASKFPYLPDLNE